MANIASVFSGDTNPKKNTKIQLQKYNIGSNISEVAVLMSTYNGKKYLKEQIDSILKQKSVNVTLFIRDDGSSDNTLTIIESYLPNNNIILIKGTNIGAPCSFASLVKYVSNLTVNFDYYSFSDQDDIWLPSKLIRGINYIKEQNEPCLYCSNQILYINNEEKGFRYNKELTIDLWSHILKNDISGCTMVMNSRLFNILNQVGFPRIDILNFRMHDTWTLLIACIYGKVIYDKNSEILYRIHDSNCVGIKKDNFWNRIKRRFFYKVPAKNLRSKTAKELLFRCDFKRKEDEELVKIFANYQNSLFDKKRLLQKVDSICEISGESKVSLYLKILLNIF